MANLKVTLVKSTIGAVPKHKKTVEALGLKKTSTRQLNMPDNAATRGMVQQVRHLVKVEEDLINKDKEVQYMDLSNLQTSMTVPNRVIISEEAVATVQETVRPQVRAIKDRKLVQELPRPGFEGGQMPLYRRLPKRGFTMQKLQRHRWRSMSAR